MSTAEVPLIWTTKGNIPIEGLDHAVQWLEDDTSISLIETFKLNGEVVKRNVHARLKEGVAAIPEQATF